MHDDVLIEFQMSYFKLHIKYFILQISASRFQILGEFVGGEFAGGEAGV